MGLFPVFHSCRHSNQFLTGQIWFRRNSEWVSLAAVLALCLSMSTSAVLAQDSPGGPGSGAGARATAPGGLDGKIEARPTPPGAGTDGGNGVHDGAKDKGAGGGGSGGGRGCPYRNQQLELIV